MPYADADAPEAMAGTNPRYIHGYLTLDDASGYSHFIATDEHGQALDLSQLSLVHPRGATTYPALATLVERLPKELVASQFPCPA